MTTRVVNLRMDPERETHRTTPAYDPTNPDHVYIGRANSRRGLKASKWANPYPMPSERERYRVITQYGAHLETRPDLIAALPELRGKVLYCFCHPKACHGHLLAGYADHPEEAAKAFGVPA